MVRTAASPEGGRHPPSWGAAALLRHKRDAQSLSALDVAAVDPLQPREHAQHGRLARAIATDQAHPFPAVQSGRSALQLHPIPIGRLTFSIVIQLIAAQRNTVAGRSHLRWPKHSNARAPVVEVMYGPRRVCSHRWWARPIVTRDRGRLPVRHRGALGAPLVQMAPPPNAPEPAHIGAARHDAHLGADGAAVGRRQLADALGAHFGVDGAATKRARTAGREAVGHLAALIVSPARHPWGRVATKW
ncbi:hypothetical protein Tchar_01798 [Tepidimonas charontis]|uniref:Uncharacterized protein n=1 Tax=Tepidimonas charontis TaxID=2267262 RepID=A0A554XBQ2_9BURK|nr:hypothetical protein Tchar_01798 [Tepidimonas charontis]